MLMTVLLAGVVLTICQLRPLMLDSAVKLLRNTADAVVNRAVLDVFEDMMLEYDDLMVVSSDEMGRITSLRANARTINELKARVSLEVHRALETAKELSVGIPLGTLSGVTVLSGLGPMIPCRALGSAVPQVQLQYHFDGAGINQTLHSILMTVAVPLSVTMPLQGQDTEVKCSFLVGETVLVGMVPDSYTNVISDPEVADDLFNYGDAG